MKKRKIGSLQVSEIGVGCNNFGRRIDEPRTHDVVHAALDAGITFFDTADIYGGTKSEEFLGRALGNRRREVIIATKFGLAIDEHRKGARPDYVRRALEDSLRRLGTDYIDLYQLHEPDPATPIGETLGALNELVVAGKVREIGCSNFSVGQLREAIDAAGAGAASFVSVQNEYSLLHRAPEPDVLPECSRVGVAFLPYYPLARGLLTGKYRKGRRPPPNSRLASGSYDELLTEETFDKIEVLLDFAERAGHTLLELTFSWLLSRRTVSSVIAGATTPRQVQANATAAAWRLTDADLEQIDAIVIPPG